MFELIDYLQSKDVDIKMIVLEKEGPIYEELEKRGIKYKHIYSEFWVGKPWEKNIDVEKRFESIFESAIVVANQIRKWGCDIVYTNTSVINVGNIAATLINKPHVWHIRESIKDNDTYKLLMPFENMAGHMSGSNNLLIFISKYLEDQFAPYKIYDNYRQISNHVNYINLDLKDAPKEIKVDVVIPFYNDPSTIKCLESIVKYKSESLNKVYVIDDQGPNRDTAKLVEDFTKDYDWIEYIQNEENKGFVYTCNRGMSELSDNDVILLNTDTEVTKNWIEKLKQVGYQNEKFATVTPLSNAASYFSIPDQFEREHDGKPDESAAILELVAPMNYFESHTGHGFCFYVKRSTIDKFGIFDYETFGKGYGEESDYSARIYKAGYINAISTKTYIYHLEGQSFGTTTREKKKEFTAPNRAKLLKRHPEILEWEKDFHTHHYLDDIKKLFKYFKKHPNLVEEDKVAVVGSITPNKGQLDVVKAVAEINKKGKVLNLLLVGEEGDEAYVNEIKTYAKENDVLEKIHFVGTLRQPFAPITMSKFCITSSLNEAWGRVTVEYMLYGKPVIGTNNGGTAEMIEDGKTGYLYEAGDIKDLASKMEKLLEDEKLVEKMGEAAKEKVKEINNEDYGELIYQELVKLKPDNQMLGYSAFASSWFLSNVFKSRIRKQILRSVKASIKQSTLVGGTWRIYKKFRTKLAIKKRIYQIVGKDNPYG